MNSRWLRGTTPAIVSTAQQLRQNLTPAEVILWDALRNTKLKGLKFRCQHPVASFIVDFYRVIRFRNREVMSDLKGVLQKIAAEIEKAQSSQSPPEWGI